MIAITFFFFGEEDEKKNNLGIRIVKSLEPIFSSLFAWPVRYLSDGHICLFQPFLSVGGRRRRELFFLSTRVHSTMAEFTHSPNK